MISALISLALLTADPTGPVDFGPLCPETPAVDFSGLAPPVAAFPARKFKPPVVPAATADVVLDRFNAARARAGAPPFRRDSRLDAAAQRHADDLHAGRAYPHEGLVRRIQESGFPVFSLGDPNITFGNVSEFVGIGGYDLDELVAEPGRKTHGGDFRERKFDSIGIGRRGHYTVFDYGASGAVAATPTPPPTVYRLADSTGFVWTHADPAYLQQFVASRDATLAAAVPGFVAVPGRVVVFPTRAACTSGSCGR